MNLSRYLRLDLIVLATIASVAVGQDSSRDKNKEKGGNPTASSTPSKTTKVADLTNRYRLVERYTREQGEDSTGLVGVYRVGLVEVVKEAIDSPNGGTPRRSEVTRQSIFKERAAETTSQGVVTASIRAFDGFRVRPEDRKRTMSLQPMTGLKILERPRGGGLPLVLSLVEGRNLTDYEYEVAARQVFVPHLAAILPVKASLVGDSWPIPPRGVQALLGEVHQSNNLVVKFSELRKEVDGPRMVAVLTISGKATLAAGETTVSAEALFTFVPPPSPPRPNVSNLRAPSRPTDASIEARGAITELRLGRATIGPLPGPGRLRFQVTHEVILHRQLGLTDEDLPLPRPEVPSSSSPSPGTLPHVPGPGDPNASLTLLEPSSRFSLQHPQDFLPPERSLFEPPAPGSAVLVRKGTDMIQIEFVPKTLKIEDLQARLAAKYALMKLEVIKGQEEWLPEPDWPKMKVYHIEAAVKIPDRASGGAKLNRIHFDGYLLQSGQSASILAIGTTSADAVAPFRREVEQILKSIQLNPPVPR